VPANAGAPSRPEWVDNLPGNLLLYRQTYLEQVRHLRFLPSGLSLETYAIANAIGSCIIHAPELHAKLVHLLMPHELDSTADRVDSLEALVASAALEVCHQGKDQVFVKEITGCGHEDAHARGRRQVWHRGFKDNGGKPQLQVML
jgi:hypothetical protein